MDMTFEQFAAEYREAFRLMMSYTSQQVGSQVYAEKMAALADAHPEWAEQVENDTAS